MKRTLYVMRGLPGAGKSTRAKMISRERGGDSLIASTDDFFTDDDGVYRFDGHALAEAHAWNLDRARAAMDRGVPTVIIDNTNIRRAHFAPYVDHAVERGYDVVIESVICPLHDDALAKRTIHGVPVGVIARMRETWEYDEVPPRP